MTRNVRFPRKLLLGLTLLACVSIVAPATSRERRHVGLELREEEKVSSHRPGRIQTAESQSFKASTGKNNEITAEPGKKVSHRLIGGHLRVDSKRRREESLWDDGILMSSAGNGKETKSSGRGEDDEEKKTLSQQVKEGKYGLIQNEIYAERPKRPGIISYLGNPEVPKDTVDNLGGLDEEEIWLAENHVLVLRGGKFPEHEAGQHGSSDGSQTWPPIDDYTAPRRPVKIPPRPKIPPPFPVQLAEGGPIQIIGPNGTRDIENATIDFSTDPLYAKGILPGEGPFFQTTLNGSITTGLEPAKDAKKVNRTTVSGQDEKKTKSEPFPPFYHAYPPGAVFVPPPSNQTDYDDEDQSIYYPPPYSFQYSQDNTTAVPPGPLVPGIILPPPPDFFTALDEKKTTTKKYTTKRPLTTPSPRPRPTYLPPRKLTTKTFKTSTTVPVPTTKSTVAHSVTRKLMNRTPCKNGTRTSKNRQRTQPRIEVTTSTSENPPTIGTTEFLNVGSVTGNLVTETTTEKSRGWTGLGNRKAAPVLSYIATTTASSLERPIEVTPASIKSIVTSHPGKQSNQASYYFYEEPINGAVDSTASPPPIYYQTTTESPYYKIEPLPVKDEPKKQYYNVETIPSQETSKDYSVKLTDSYVEDPEIYRYNDPVVTLTSSKYDDSSVRSHNQRMLSDEAPVYYQAISPGRPVVAIQSYYTTPKPQPYYREPEARPQYDFGKSAQEPKPVYQFSFEAENYSKRGDGGQRSFYKQQQQHSQRQQVSYDYQDTKQPVHAQETFDYEDTEPLPEQRLQPGSNVPYKTQRPIETTPNPQHAYFTQQDEKLLDDVTKEYFTIFGQKIGSNRVPSTTPIYPKSNSVTENPRYSVKSYVSENYNKDHPPTYKTPNVKVQYGDQQQRPYSLKDDTLVNYKNPLPPINPDSEFIAIVDPKRGQQQPSHLQGYRVATDGYRMILPNQENQRLSAIRDYASQRVTDQGNRPPNNFVSLVEPREQGQNTYPTRPLTLEDDIAVNYRDPRPPVNPDAEFIAPITGGADNRPDKANAYFAYRLPGDGGHFYFLTPQSIGQRQDRNGGYLYPKPRGPRPLLRRRRRGPVSV